MKRSSVGLHPTGFHEELVYLYAGLSYHERNNVPSTTARPSPEIFLKSWSKNWSFSHYNAVEQNHCGNSGAIINVLRIIIFLLRSRRCCTLFNSSELFGKIKVPPLTASCCLWIAFNLYSALSWDPFYLLALMFKIHSWISFQDCVPQKGREP